MTLRDLYPGDPVVLGPYRLRGRLGAGGMGVVYLGFDEAGGAVAVKALPPVTLPDARTRLKREAEAMAAVNSRRVARFVAADIPAEACPNSPWLALAYIAGPSVAEAKVPLEESPLRQLATGLAEALLALEQAGVVHRDLKPGNVILSYDGPVLVDFGIARSGEATSLTHAGTAVGSPGWLSPEQLRGEPITAATDMWGWGAVLAYAATGRPPFGEGPLEALAWRITSNEPALAGTPEWLAPLVTAALQKDPAARPSAAELLRQLGAEVQQPASQPTTPAPQLVPTSAVTAPLAAATAGDHPLVSTAPTAESAARWDRTAAADSSAPAQDTAPAGRRRPTLLATGAAVGLAAVLGIAILASLGGAEPKDGVEARETSTPMVASTTGRPSAGSPSPTRSATPSAGSPSPARSATPTTASSRPTRSTTASASPSPRAKKSEPATPPTTASASPPRQIALQVFRDGCGVIRGETRPNDFQNLTWVVRDKDGFQVLGRNALRETRYRYYRPGTYTVALEAYTENGYAPVSKTVTIRC